jgi:hypothetical protein
MLVALFACQPDYIVVKDTGSVGPDEGEGSETTTEEDYSEYDGATMVINEPHSGDFLPLGEDATFSATVYDAAGQILPFDDIVWTSDVDAAWTPVGELFTDATLDVGTHTLTATAGLPNGDRLVYAIGGVLVQSPYAGTYVGTLAVDASGDYNGTTYTITCSGATTLIVDTLGETVTGDAGCLLSIQGYDLDTTYAFDLDNTDGALGGTIALDLTYYAFDIDSSGTLTEDGELEGAFTTDVAGYLTLDGTYSATRITRDVSAG